MSISAKHINLTGAQVSNLALGALVKSYIDGMEWHEIVKSY